MKLLLLITITLLAFWFLFGGYVKGEEEQFNPEYHLDLTLSYEFSTTTMSATVPVNPCNHCLRYEIPSKCKVECKDIIIID